ncbi:2996_t:CDS:1 [Cetraspora pellucida]|uniref:2996_t:CDS:1 n=1 Tax=Cetraspora pellucida TaxID=1433469 RepID=A0A9N9IAZ5_9GLOM|nr:2996_t:CDS:1 [Cetraspora pellucida]
MIVYRFHEKQYRYNRNFINFFKFFTCLSQHLSEKDPMTFRDFKVYRNKVTCALYRLKANNSYYSEIDIDNEDLQSLLENGFLNNQLQNNQITNDKINKVNKDNILMYTFISFLFSNN